MTLDANSRTCGACGADAGAGSSFCPRCGERLPDPSSDAAAAPEVGRSVIGVADDFGSRGSLTVAGEEVVLELADNVHRWTRGDVRDVSHDGDQIRFRAGAAAFALTVLSGDPAAAFESSDAASAPNLADLPPPNTTRLADLPPPNTTRLADLPPPTGAPVSPASRAATASTGGLTPSQRFLGVSIAGAAALVGLLASLSDFDEQYVFGVLLLLVFPLTVVAGSLVIAGGVDDGMRRFEVVTANLAAIQIAAAISAAIGAVLLVSYFEGFEHVLTWLPIGVLVAACVMLVRSGTDRS